MPSWGQDQWALHSFVFAIHPFVSSCRLFTASSMRTDLVYDTAIRMFIVFCYIYDLSSKVNCNLVDLNLPESLLL